jgi:hypothetical protein
MIQFDSEQTVHEAFSIVSSVHALSLDEPDIDHASPPRRSVTHASFRGDGTMIEEIAEVDLPI